MFEDGTQHHEMYELFPHTLKVLRPLLHPEQKARKIDIADLEFEASKPSV